jgi:intracellular multiplication protein IcmK
VRNRVIQLSLAPTADSPVLALYPNMATTVVILDASGQPWPIEKVGVSGTQGKTDYAAAEQLGLATVLISSGVHNAYGTIDLKLKALDRTVKLLFTHGWSNTLVDGQVEAHLDALGPLAAPETSSAQTVPRVDPAMLDFLNDVPPPEAAALEVSGDPTARAWSYHGRIVLLTQNPLISPQPLAQTQSGSGRRLYLIEPIDIVLLSVAGHQTEVIVEMPP